MPPKWSMGVMMYSQLLYGSSTELYSILWAAALPEKDLLDVLTSSGHFLWETLDTQRMWLRFLESLAWCSEVQELAVKVLVIETVKEYWRHA